MTPYDNVVMDVSYYAYRSWWACRELKKSDGTHTGLEFGFLKNLLYVVRNYYPAKLVLAWDGHPKRCTDILTTYKANRDKSMKEHEAPWGPRMERMRLVLTGLVQNIYDPDWEADEQIALYVKQQELKDRSTLMLTNDTDMDQLVSEKTHKFGGDKEGILDLAKVKEKWGVTPEKITLIRAISGDSSDGISGIPRVPEKVKLALALKSENIEQLIEQIAKTEMSEKTRLKLEEGKDIIRRNYKLSSLRDLTGEPRFGEVPNGDKKKVIELCRELELNSLLDRKEWQLLEEQREAT